MSLLVLPAPMTEGRLLSLEGQHFSQAASEETPVSSWPFSNLRNTVALGLLDEVQTLIHPGTGQGLI